MPANIHPGRFLMPAYHNRNHRKMMPLSLPTEKAVSLLKIISHPKRLAILFLLCEGERSVGELSEAVKLRQPAMSQHLQKLRHAGLVESRHKGPQVIYTIHNDKVADFIHELETGA